MDRVDILKLDIESSEKPCLEGARKTISKHRPKVMVEVHNINQEKAAWFEGYFENLDDYTWSWVPQPEGHISKHVMLYAAPGRDSAIPHSQTARVKF
jgi:hypothetical protein